MVIITFCSWVHKCTCTIRDKIVYKLLSTQKWLHLCPNSSWHTDSAELPVSADKIKKLSALFEAEQAKCAAECTMLQDRLLGAEQQQESLRALLQASSSQAQHSQQQERQLRQELADSKAALADLASSQITLQGHCSTLESQLADMQSNSTTRPSQQPGTVQADCVAVFRLLEQQLVSLSDNLKFKEQQVAALQQTVQQQCDERTLMQIRCMQSGAGHGPGNDGTTAASCSVSVSGPTEHLRTSDDASQSVSSTLPTQEVAVGKGPDRASTSAQSKSKLNRLASASEQQHGKSGLLGRIMATSSTTGNLKFA